MMARSHLEISYKTRISDLSMLLKSLLHLEMKRPTAGCLPSGGVQEEWPGFSTAKGSRVLKSSNLKSELLLSSCERQEE